MRIVLLDDVSNLGDAGTVVEVKNGYARNFLIPRRLAAVATRDALNRVELIRRAAEVKRIRRMAEAADKFTALSGKTLTIRMKAGTQSRIFGAVTATMIADEIGKQFGIAVDRRHVMLDEPLKHLGEYTVPLRASAEVTGEIKVGIEPELKPGQAARRASAAPAAPAAPSAEATAAALAAGQPVDETIQAGAETLKEAETAAEAHDKYGYHDEDSKPEA
jgi:large subunit ribosomal protein L9